MSGAPTGADLYKNSILSIISEMATCPWLFATTETAFSRTKSLSFETMIKSILSMQGGTIARGLSTLGIDVTTSGFVQRRDQILPEAFEFLFQEFTKAIPVKQNLKGYRILAVDGSDIAAPLNKDSDSYREAGKITKSGKLAKGCNLVHLNAVYDVINKLYVDAIITPKPTEHDAAENLMRRYRGEKAIILMDRGYIGYNLMETMIRNPDIDFVVRVSNTNAYKCLKGLQYCDIDEDKAVDIVTALKDYDPDKNVLLVAESPFGKPKKDVTWHYGRYGHIEFRVVRFRINDNPDPNKAYETLVTSLPRDKFPLEMMKELYHMRWGIETSFRELKYNVGVVNFHSKKDSAVYQSIWAALIMYNFSMACAALAVVKQKPERKYIYAVSIADAVAACMDFFAQVKIHAPPDGKSLIKRIEKHIQPIRPGRADERKLYPKGAVYFMYRVAA